MITKEATISIPAPNIQLLRIKIKGTTPLIFHKWSEKAKKMIKDKEGGKAHKGREIRDPKKEYEESFYYNKDKQICITCDAIKQSLVGACRSINGLPMTIVRGAVFIVGDTENLIKVDYKKKEMREDMVRVGNGSADIRYRGQLTDWNIQLLIKYNADVLTAEQVTNLVQIAGFSQGLLEWRPERGGSFGCYEVETK